MWAGGGIRACEGMNENAELRATVTQHEAWSLAGRRDAFFLKCGPARVNDFETHAHGI